VSGSRLRGKAQSLVVTGDGWFEVGGLKLGGSRARHCRGAVSGFGFRVSGMNLHRGGCASFLPWDSGFGVKDLHRGGLAGADELHGRQVVGHARFRDRDTRLMPHFGY